MMHQKATNNTEFSAQWLTMPEFAERRPTNLYHKESADFAGHSEQTKNLHVLVRTTISVKQPETGYFLRLTADDYYKLYVNGRFIGQGPAPAYPEHYYYNEVDLTPYIKKGKNVIGLHLYYQGLVNRVWNSGDGRFCMATQLIEGDLAQELRWKYQVSHAYSGSVIGYDTQFLENFDSNLWELGWNLVEYQDEQWDWMVPADWADYAVQKQPTKPLDCYKIKPKKLIKNSDGWWIDIGEEVTGALVVTAAGKKGSKICIQCGEELDDLGKVRYDMRCNCVYEEFWTLNGEQCTLEPYDYKAFRYAQLIPEPEAELLDVKVLVRHYPMNESFCTFSSSNVDLDNIFRICKNGVKYGTQESYLDCPTREKGQYLGDAVVTGNAQVWLSGSTNMLRKCIEQFAWTNDICPGLMAVAPGSYMQEIADFSLLWSQLLMLDYRFTGDLEFLRRFYPIAKGIVQHFSQYARKDGLLEQVADKWNLVDWPENLRDNYDFDLSRPVVAAGCHNVINALYIGAAKTLSEIENLLGLPKTHSWESWNDAYLRVFYRPSSGLLADSETSNHCAIHSNLYALYFGLLSLKQEQQISDFLVEKGLCCGVFTSYFVLKGLARAKRFDYIYRILMNETSHSWINMVREGATTCWEAWGKKQKWNTSLCHPWASAPVSILIECIAGFQPDPTQKDGFRYTPHIPQDLDSFKLTIPFRNSIYEIVKQDGKVECHLLSQ